MSGAIKINGTSSGSTTITAPASGGDETIELSTALAAKADASAVPILQVIQGTTSTLVTNTTSTLADTGLTATITPSSVSSKILVVVSQEGCGKLSGNSQTALTLKLLRDASVIWTISVNACYTNSSSDLIVGSLGGEFLDSPATTSAITYKTQFANSQNASGVRTQWSSEPSTITLYEIAG